MLTPREAREEVAAWTYKPGYQLELDVSSIGYNARCTMHLLARITNTYRPDRETVLDYREPVPPMALEDTVLFGEWLRTFLGRFEHHERDEWMLRNGVRVFDPHADRDWTPPIQRSNA